NYTSYTMTTGVGQTDCPRVTYSRQWAENWNGSQEAVTTYSRATDHSSGQETMPDNQTVYRELYATSGWQRGLTTEIRFYATIADAQADYPKKRTTTAYTQDDTTLSYQKNPRVTETNIYDSELNHKRTTIDYGPGSGPGN